MPSVARIAALLLGASVLVGGLARADERDARPFPDRLPARARDRIRVERRVVAEDVAERPLINWPWVETLDGDGPARIASAAGKLLRLTDGATDGERALVTRYTTPEGDVHGDGRAVTLAETIVEVQGRRRNVLDVQAQGELPTGQRRDGVDPARDGQKPLDHALANLLLTTVLEESAVATSRVLSILPRPGGRAQVRRAGNFERFAHEFLVGDDPEAARELLDHVGAALAEHRGQRLGMGYGRLYRALVERAAIELVDLYWMRLVHGGISYDNIGFRQVTDVESMGAVDRPHPTYSPTPRSPGFGREGAFVMGRIYVAELREMMLLARHTPAEAAQLQAIDAEALARDRYFEHMARRMLNHVGFDDDVVQAVTRAVGKEPMLDLLDVYLHHAEVTDERPTRMGSRGQTVVESPARYDLFRGLASLVEISGAHLDPAVKRARLAQAMRVSGVTDGDLAAADQLLAAFAPLLDAALADVQGAARVERQTLFVREARRVNRPTRELVRAHFEPLTRKWASELMAGRKPDLVLNEVLALARDQVRKGKKSPAALAMALRRGDLAADDRGVLTLATHRDAYFRVDERSDGSRDWFEVRVGRRFAEPRRVGPLRVQTTQNGKLAERMIAPEIGAGDGDARIVIPAEPGTDLLVVSATGPDGRGAEFRLRPALGSPLLDAELGIWAEDQGVVRRATSSARRDAVRTLALGRRRIHRERVRRGAAADGRIVRRVSSPR